VHITSYEWRRPFIQFHYIFNSVPRDFIYVRVWDITYIFRSYTCFFSLSLYQILQSWLQLFSPLLVCISGASEWTRGNPPLFKIMLNWQQQHVEVFWHFCKEFITTTWISKSTLGVTMKWLWFALDTCLLLRHCNILLTEVLCIEFHKNLSQGLIRAYKFV
jgi:hypothetical protein